MPAESRAALKARGSGIPVVIAQRSRSAPRILLCPQQRCQERPREPEEAVPAHSRCWGHPHACSSSSSGTFQTWGCLGGWSWNLNVAPEAGEGSDCSGEGDVIHRDSFPQHLFGNIWDCGTPGPGVGPWLISHPS